MSGLIGLAGEVKGVVTAPKIKRENAAFLIVSKLAVAFCLVAILFLALDSYFGDKIHCFSTTEGNKEAPGKDRWMYIAYLRANVSSLRAL